jgi:hypothetical protein
MSAAATETALGTLRQVDARPLNAGYAAVDRPATAVTR